MHVVQDHIEVTPQRSDGLDALACDAMHDGVARYSADKRLVFWNQAFATFVHPAKLCAGMHFEEVVAAVAPTRVAQGHAANVETYVRDRLASHAPLKRTGERRHVNGRMYLLREQRTSDGGWIETVTDVTEWHERAESLASMVDAAPVQLAHFDAQNRLQIWNRAWGDAVRRTIGRDPQAGETQARFVRARARADGLAEPEIEQELARQVGRHNNHLSYVFERNGRRLEVTKTRAPGGGTITSAHDVTDLRAAEENAARNMQELEHAHVLLQSILNALPVDVAYFDNQDYLRIWNQSYESRFKRSAGRPLAAGEHQEQIVRDRFASLQDTPAAKERIIQDHIDLHSNLTTCEEEVFGQSVIRHKSRAPDGGTITTIIDITKRKHAERNLQTVFDHAPTGMLTVDPAGVITVANRAAEELLGYAPGELAGLSVDTLVPETAGDGHGLMRSDFLRAAKPDTLASGRELQILRNDGSVVPVEISLAPITVGDNMAMVVALNDISARQAARAAEEERTATLERANQALQHFAYVSSHDLQEPLRVVSSFAGLLERRFGSSLDEKGHRYIAQIVDGTGRMSRLIQDLLAYSQVGTAPEQIEHVALDDVTAEIMSDFRRLLQKTEGQIEATGLPHVVTERVLVAQVLRNLIGNALKYRSAAPPRILVFATREPTVWRIAVRDNGIGIQPEYQQQIFEVFKRLHTRSEYDGTGIGLAICQRAVQFLGGKITVRNNATGGSIFSFTLPIRSLPHDT